MDDQTMWAIIIITCAVYYTIKNWLAYKRGKDF